MSTAPTPSGDLFYADDGPAAPRAVVALHSLGTDHRLWSPVLADLLAAGGRVLRPDSRGHGRSAFGGLTSSRDWVDDLDRILDHAGVERADLIGVSMGTAQALAYALVRPDRVASLVLADGFGRLDAEVAASKVTALAGGAQQAGMAAWADAYVASTLIGASPACAELVRDAVSGVPLEAYTASAEVCFAPPPGREEDIDVPALVLWGALDEKTPRWMSDALADRIPRAQLVEVPDAGHLSCVDQPAAFAAAVRAFWAREGLLQTTDARRT